MRDAAATATRWRVPAAALLLCALGLAGCQSSGSVATPPTQEAAASDSEPLGIGVDVAGAGNAAGMGVSVDLSQLLKATRGATAPSPPATNAAPATYPPGNEYPRATACTGLVTQTVSTQAAGAATR